MTTVSTESKKSDVRDAVAAGLRSTPKKLPSWLFYDATGDRIFQEIMRMPEYYLTRCEYTILESEKERLVSLFIEDDEKFDLIEFGAGDGIKTEILLTELVKRKADFSYKPVDVSLSALTHLHKRLQHSFQKLKIDPINKRYEEAASDSALIARRKVFLFLGANIGNFTNAGVRSFVRHIASMMNHGDLLLIGFDLIKDPHVIRAAYDDAAGITRRFNLNLLARLNRELGADFELSRFEHYPLYDPETGTAKSYLVSQDDQDVHLGAIDLKVHLDKWELIHTEVSQKYSVEAIYRLALESGLAIDSFLYDDRKYFTDVLFRKED